MANVTIPNLTSATTIAPSTDLMVLEQTNGTRKATLSQIFTSSATSGSGLGITSGGVYTIKRGLDSNISDINTLLGNTSIAGIGNGTVTGAISKLNSNLNTNLSYKNLGTKLGTQYISLPDNWKKIHVVVALDTTDKIAMDDIDGSSNEYFQIGYYQDSTHFCRGVVQVTTDNRVTLTSCFYNSTTNVANQKYFAVKYR